MKESNPTKSRDRSTRPDRTRTPAQKAAPASKDTDNAPPQRMHAHGARAGGKKGGTRTRKPPEITGRYVPSAHPVPPTHKLSPQHKRGLIGGRRRRVATASKRPRCGCNTDKRTVRKASRKNEADWCEKELHARENPCSASSRPRRSHHLLQPKLQTRRAARGPVLHMGDDAAATPARLKRGQI